MIHYSDSFTKIFRLVLSTFFGTSLLHLVFSLGDAFISHIFSTVCDFFSCQSILQVLWLRSLVTGCERATRATVENAVLGIANGLLHNIQVVFLCQRSQSTLSWFVYRPTNTSTCPNKLTANNGLAVQPRRVTSSTCIH